MRRKISLYIADIPVDIDEQNLVLFNYTMEDLGNPTIVKNSYSQQVTIPATPTNNRIFGDYFRLDRITGNGFNVLARTPFKIFNEMNEILESGYCKLDSVQSAGRKIYSYSISLYGGLGGYFYDLSYKADGTQMNLGDLTYKDANGVEFVPNTKTINLNVTAIDYCWMTLYDGNVRTQTAWCNAVNFAPTYNGIPADFDATKALVDNNTWLHISPSGTSGVNDRPHPQSNGTYLLTMETAKDAEEMRDYRTYLQRPVLSVKAFMDAMVARGGFTLSEGAEDVIGEDMWITLQLPERATSYASYPMKSMFNGSMTPADMLITLAKSFGMVFLFEPSGVTMMTRDEFFSGGQDIDLSRRIGRIDTITPMVIDSKWYVWRNEVKGAFADRYQADWNRVYGDHRVNTNYDFNADTKVLTDSLKTRGAVQSLGWSSMFQFVVGNMPPFPATFFEKVTFTGYNQSGTESSTIDVAPYPFYDSSTRVFYNDDNPLYDVFDKAQFHDKDRKPIDGAGVLLFFVGMQSLPSVGGLITDKLRWHITEGDQDLFNLLNDGNHCWDMRLSAGTRITRLPQFSRWKGDRSLDFGTPQEIAVPGVTPPSGTIYDNHWKRYIEDRYDMDTTIIRCKVNLGGFRIGNNLLRNFYWFENTWWVLNKIINHSLTTYDQTECEFVRVQDKDNYKNGQS